MFLLLLVATVGIIATALRKVGHPHGDPDRPSRTAEEPGSGTGKPPRSGKAKPLAAILDACDIIDSDPSRADLALRTLREQLFQSDRLQAATAIADFLQSGRDSATQLPFAVGPEGTLLAAPTLRSTLMDWLPALDPQMALDLSRQILRDTRSADEYALALRNLAWNNLDGDLHPELSAAFHRMLDDPLWKSRPSDGFLEAFDTAVELGGLSTFLRLESLASPDAQPESLVHASCMSMDRMILRDPSLLTSAWNQPEEWMKDAPLQRASLMSRLDITRNDHRTVFLDYLGSTAVGDAERQAFLALFPNGNHLHGEYLITRGEKPMDIASRAERDRAILREIDNLAREAPPQLSPWLLTTRSRLEHILGERE